jgi:hypothetical protein
MAWLNGRAQALSPRIVAGQAHEAKENMEI